MPEEQRLLGQAPGSSRRRGRGPRIVIHLGAAVVTILSWWVVAAIAGAVSFGSSVCGSATAGQVWDYHYELLKYGLLGALVPLILGAVIHRLGERAWPWFAVAAVAGVFVVVTALRAQPSQFCF